MVALGIVYDICEVQTEIVSSCALNSINNFKQTEK